MENKTKKLLAMLLMALIAISGIAAWHTLKFVPERKKPVAVCGKMNKL